MAKKRKTRNKFRDLMGDYYLTNQAVGKEYDQRYQEEKAKKEKKSWSPTEKTMLAITAIVVVLIVVKYIIL